MFLNNFFLLQVPSAQDLFIFLLMCAFLMMNLVVLIWCKAGYDNKLMWDAAPHIGWHIANTQLLAALFLKKNEVTSRDSLGWVLLLDYLIYVTLPIRLRYCIILSLGTCASYVAALVGLAKSDLHFYQQVSAFRIHLMLDFRLFTYISCLEWSWAKLRFIANGRFISYYCINSLDFNDSVYGITGSHVSLKH